MTRRPHIETGRWKRRAALPLLLLAFPVSAQAQQAGSVQDYRLPAAPTPTPTAAGPVDTDHPVAAPTQAAPAPTPAPTASPAITLPAAAPTAAAPRETAGATTAQRPSVSPGPSAPAAASPAPIVATPSEAAPISPVVVAPVPTPEPAAATPSTGLAHWLWLGGGSLLVLVLGGLLRRRRAAAAEEVVAYEPARVPAEPRPAPGPPATLTPPDRLPAAPLPPPPAPPAPQPAAFPPASSAARPLEMALEARHLSRALINATLAYRLTLTNRAETATGPLRIAGDIVTAHASLSAQEQLAPGDAALAAIHEVASLAPGESVSLTGELRLPLASILPINSGGSRVFVPLARFRAEMPAGTTTRIFVVGQASDQPGGALRPFPLDRGPGVDRALGQRELEMPA